MARQRSSGEPPTLRSSTEPQCPTPCTGLVGIQIASARMDVELQGIQDHFARQNGSIQRIEEKVNHLDEKMQAGAEDRQKQIKDVRDNVDATRRELSNNHAETLREVAKTAQDTTRIVVGAAITMIVMLTGAVITLLTKLSSLP